jgi:glycosyltransferase involved in cell wall biosynthesis
MWPESIKAVGAMKNSLAIGFFENIEMFLYHKAAKIVSVTESFKNILIQRGIDPNKIEVVTNGVDLSRFSPMPKDKNLVREYGLDVKFVAGYIGTHGMAHNLETILDAADRIRKTDEGDKFRFIFLGDGARKKDLIGRATKLKLDNVIFIDSVPKEEVVRYWSLLDVSIIHLKKTPLFTTVIPSKLFESMGMGIPVLHGVMGESAEIVKKESIGVVFEPENAEDLSKKLIGLKNNSKLYNQMRNSCLEAAKKYDRAELAVQMLTVLEGFRPQ